MKHVHIHNVIAAKRKLIFCKLSASKSHYMLFIIHNTYSFASQDIFYARKHIVLRVWVEPCEENYRYLVTITKLNCAHSKHNSNVETFSGETGGGSSGVTLFKVYNLSPRKHYSNAQGRSIIIFIVNSVL